MPRWVNKTCKDVEREFYRLPGREQEPGIGWERRDLMNAFLAKGLRPPIGFWEELEDNNRFFNKEWQLIGSHDIGNRLWYWRKIRGDVPFGKQLEKDFHFHRFLDAAHTNKPWNLPGFPDPIRIPLTNKQPKLMSKKIY
jgi:hypothetical protein